jgi:hypothetical protein
VREVIESRRDPPVVADHVDRQAGIGLAVDLVEEVASTALQEGACGVGDL